MVWRERKRNSLRTRGYKPAHADCEAEKRRSRPQTRKVDADPVLSARVRADLFRSRTPRQVAGRLLLEAADPSVGSMPHSPDAQGRTVSHEAVYRWIHALPKGELARSGILLSSRRTRRKPRGEVGRRGAPTVGMTSIDARPEETSDRRVPGSWEGDLVVGRSGRTACATLVERTGRYLVVLGVESRIVV